MQGIFTEYWWLFLVALLIGIAVAWYVLVASRRTRVDIDRRDSLDDGAERTQRNQALIDAPPAAAGELSRAANTQDTAHADAQADAEAGASPEQPRAAIPSPQVKAAQAAAAPGAGPAASATPPAAPAAAPTPAAATIPADAGHAGGSGEDDLTRIKGVGPKLSAMLRDLGVTSFAHIAAWDDAEIARVDAQLGRFQGRIERDNWIEQAKLLDSGDTDAYQARFGAQ